MLYMSAYNVKPKDLANYKLPEREDVVYWEGVKHQDLIKMVRKVAKDRKLRITDEQFQVGNDGHTLFASWDFSKPVPGMKGMTMSMGYRGSNMGRYAHTFVVGSRVAVCQNGMISGEFGYKKKHSSSLDLHDLVETSFERYTEEIKTIRPMVHSLRQCEIDDGRAAEIMLESARQGIISWSRIRIIDKEWREPSHKAFQEANGWSLYNAYTMSAKLTTPRSQIEIMRDMPALILGETQEEE